MKPSDVAKERGERTSASIAKQLRKDSNGDDEYVLIYMAMLLSGLLGTASAALGENAAFELWDAVRKLGKTGMQMINATESAVKH